jgi:CHAT domain-containing protein
LHCLSSGSLLLLLAESEHTEGTVSFQAVALAEKIKEKGRQSPAELTPLLHKAEQLAHDETQDLLTRALAYRAAGNAQQLLNQFQPALDNYNLAASLLETLDEPVELGRTLHAKVGMLFFLSRFEELFECSEKARHLFEQCSDRKRLARLDVNLAHAYHRLGRHKEALESSERAVAVLEEIGDTEGFITASINSGVTFTAMHDFERAEERHRAAMEAAQRLNLSYWLRLSRYNLAFLRYLGGDTATALSELDAIRKEYESINDEWMICCCCLYESEIFLEIGDLDECLRLARNARVLGEKLGLNSEVARALLYEAAAGFRVGRDDEAVILLKEVTDRFAREGDKVSTAVAMLQAALFRGEHGDIEALDDAASARSELGRSGLPHRMALADIVVGRLQRTFGQVDNAIDSFRSALAFAESSRSRWMQFHAAYEVGVTLDSRDASAAAQLFRRAESLLDSLWDRLGSDDLKMMFLADRENVYTHLVKSTSGKSPGSAFIFSEKARSRVLQERLLTPGRSMSADALASNISNDETIVEYFLSANDIFIFVLTEDGLFTHQRHGVTRHVKTEWEHLERHMASCSVKWERLEPARRHLDATAQAHLGNLYQELILPIEAQLRGTVVFAPHGFLHSIPLHALYDGKQYLCDRHKATYTPSASLYCSPVPVEDFDSPLFVAFSTTPHSSSIDEVEQSAAHFSLAEVLTNPSMCELQRAFKSPRSLIHIAGHAGVDPMGGTLSWIETSEGRLTSADLLTLNIRAQTLVITGCQTARRVVRPGDEWLGLMRSFYLSGASTIVSALWDIRDEAARRFAREFYKTFDGGNAPFAVQSAATAVRDWRGHPYFWGAFAAFTRKKLGRKP